ncbi:TIGR01777 family oxidoreductase [Dactylosporangium aurantiacum]|uniref:TIGR01777 family oxidoreductase n=1 Tax=Dactylosporangium aurantiacum TaxID=35754 RepID=A0A9Q9MG36_9ACTN|nr:TIGR01777 family oxidoreductase [Dactylosporangium aurantiacum]MDG6102388.1 TIGR01777 family oxidoreductase [Dactylosporangium aurantiacum]UWZ53320.1 TIGR01777 family oxidoreductase [Dactylosporangium aurantiacum]
MQIVIAGASGFLGGRLVPHLRAAGHQVTQLVRRPARNPGELRWDPAAGLLDASALAGKDAVINLAGAGVGDRRWTAQYKETLRSSRVDTTQTLAKAIAAAGPDGPRVLLNSSAVGFYGDTGDRPVDELSPAGEGFLADLCQVWEAATRPAEDAGARVALLRTGLPLAKDGGLLQPLYLQFKLFAGGRMGSGRQYLPWMSLPDWLDAVLFTLDRDLAGPVNLTGPEPVTNAEFSAALAKVMHRPNLLPVPGFAVKAAVGEFGGEALASQRVLPGVLVREGFPFAHRTVEAALQQAVSAST